MTSNEQARAEALYYRDEHGFLVLDPEVAFRPRTLACMPVADALADAATLRRVRGRVGSFHPLQDAAECGAAAVAEMLLLRDGPYGGAEVAYEWARDAAHAAFRAVPGLRG